MKLLLLAVGAAGIGSLGSMTAALDRGDLDEAARQGALAGPAVVEQALGSKVRTEQLAGIVAAPAAPDRLELLPALAKVAASPDRRVAIPAARAARTIARQLGELPDDLAPDDVATWRAAWLQLAKERNRFVEVRVLALDTATALVHDMDLDLLADPDPAVRTIAIELVPEPVPPNLQPALETATSDPDARVARAATKVLCLDHLLPPKRCGR